MNTYEKNAAFFLIDDKNHRSWPFPYTNWDTDFRGAGRPLTRENGDFFPIRRALSTLKGFPTIIKRDVTEQFFGTLTFEGNYVIRSGDGFFMAFFGNGGEKEAFSIKQCGEYFFCGDKKLFKSELQKKHHIKFVLDIDTGSVSIFHDGKYVSSCRFTGNATSISSFRYGYGNDDIGEGGFFTVVKLHKNYLLNDMIISDVPGELPEPYKITKSGKSTVCRKQYSDNASDCVYSIKAGSGSSTTVYAPFSRADGVVCAEIKYILPKAGATANFSLTSNETPIITISDSLSEIFCSGGSLKKHSVNVWQTLRIEADLDSKTAIIRLNGKKITVIELDNPAEFIDGLKITFDAEKAAELMLCDIFAFVIPPYPANYVPEPIIPEKKGDYYVGMNICSLWRTGDHHGWDCITPFPENKPVIGFYDEGLPETADWELKFMAEHGIDFQLYCWYAPERNAPFRFSQLSSAIHGGHMLAKYSDKVKIALLWEAQSASHPMGLDAFKKYFVPYWIDYFFSDPRYMTIDGAAIMSIYGPHQLVKDFGDEATVKKAFDYLRSEVKKLGYKDLIIMGCAENLPIYKACGFDAVHAYNWGEKGYDVDYTKSRIEYNIGLDNVHTVPTISSGYNLVGWTGFRSPNMTPEDMEKALTWCRDEVLPTFEKGWKRKLVMLSTWNEYGEGTYMMPSGLNGFGYLDSVRKVFLKDIPHTDVVPDEEQKSRICILHPQNRSTIAPLDLIPQDTSDYGVYKRFEFKTQEDLDKWEFHGFSKLEIKNGRLYGHSDTQNPYMLCKDESFMPFEAHRVSRVRANIRAYKPVNQMCCIEVQFGFKEDKTLNPKTLYCLTIPDRVAPLTISMNRVRGYPWKGKIHAFRFDPIYAVGDFELESIELLYAPPHCTLSIDGDEISAHHYPINVDGEMYIPFDTTSPLAEIKNMYYEWHGTKNQLVISSDKDYTFTVGSDTVTFDGGEFKLSKPLEMYDGIPLIPAKLFAEILGMSIEITEDEIKLSHLA